MKLTHARYFFCLSLTALLITLFHSCRQQNEFSVEVSFEMLDPTPIELYLLTESSSQLVDSTNLETSTQATLNGIAEHSSLYLLKFFNDQTIFLVIHPNDRIKVEVNNILDEITYYVKGSPDSRLVKEITDKQNIVLKTIDQLSIEWESSRTDSVILRRVDSNYSALLKEHQQYTRNFIYRNPTSLATILALYQNFGRKSQPLFDKYDDLDVYNFVDSNLTVLYPQTEAVKVLNREVTEIKEQIQHNKYIEKRVVEGFPLPKLNEVSITGDTLVINDESNKSILLYFWAHGMLILSKNLWH